MVAALGPLDALRRRGVPDFAAYRSAGLDFGELLADLVLVAVERS